MKWMACSGPRPMRLCAPFSKRGLGRRAWGRPRRIWPLMNAIRGQVRKTDRDRQSAAGSGAEDQVKLARGEQSKENRETETRETR
jgi:hypothetical protein